MIRNYDHCMFNHQLSKDQAGKALKLLIKDELIVCNMNNATVELVNLDGETEVSLPDQVAPNEDGQAGPLNYNKPSIATMLMGKIGLFLLG